jgi:hypothetical protein
MIAGVSNFSRLRREFPSTAFTAHPLAGNGRPAALLGTLFRAFGAMHWSLASGRFYSRSVCSRSPRICALRDQRLRGVASAAGGMSVGRVRS